MRQLVRLVLSISLCACGGGQEQTTGDSQEPTTGAEVDDTTAPDATATEEGPTTLLAVGTPAPDFTVSDQVGVRRTLSAERGHVVVIYFYPRDATPGCTAEACAFRDVWERFQDANIEVLGVSVDSVESHLAFAEQHQLPFSLLADTDAAITNAYGAATVDGPTVVAHRVTYIVDAQGTIAHVFDNVDPGVHDDEVLEVIQNL